MTNGDTYADQIGEWFARLACLCVQLSQSAGFANVQTDIASVSFPGELVCERFSKEHVNDADVPPFVLNVLSDCVFLC